MIHLGLLGGCVVERDGAPVTGRAAQRHHVALLAILATSPAQTASRDKLIARLWPEQDTQRARHRLSVALHVLRRGLGVDCVVTAADAVTLSPERVQTDVAAFIEAVADGRFEQAVSLYAGPFMDGFFLSRSPEFDRWAESERRRLSGLYRTALERLITEAEDRGDTGGALRWWRRMATHDRLSTPVAIGVVRALADAGDLPGALRHARAHMALLQAELDLPPDPQVLELARQLAVSAAAAAEPAVIEETPPVASSPDHRMASIVERMDDETSLGTGVWRRKLPVGLVRRRSSLVAATATLTLATAWALRADRVDVPGALASVAVRPFMAVDGSATARSLGAALADEVGRTLAYVPGLVVGGERAAPSSVVEGTIDEVDGELLVTTRLLDSPSGEVRWTQSWRSPIRDVEDLLEELSLTIADSLRLRVAPYQPKTYTESRRAYDRFLQGVSAHRRYTHEDIWTALQFYREAVEEDPGFALAHAISGNAYIHLALLGLDPRIAFPEARSHVLEALALDSTLAEAHAALGYIQVWGDRDFEAGERSLRRAVMLYPTLPQARSWYGWFALQVRHRPGQGVASVRRSLEVDPLNTARSDDVERALYMARRYEEVIEQNRITWALDLEVARSLTDSPLAHAYRELGRYDDAVEEFLALHQRVGGAPPFGLAMTFARTGREADARAILAEHEAAAFDAGSAPVAVARIYASLGDPDGAFNWLERSFDAAPNQLIGLGVDPAFDPIRSDPRYGRLLERLGLEPR